MRWLSLLAVCLSLSVINGQAYNDWVKVVNQPQGEQITFNCTNATDDPNSGHPRPEPDGSRPWLNSSVDFWLAHLEKINIGESILAGNIVVSSDGWTLTVKNVTRSNFGVYHCVMRTEEGGTYLIKWGINMRGPYFDDLWAKYDMNVIIGFSAMGGFLVLCAFVYIVYTYRWIDPEELEEESEKKDYYNQGYKNGGYTGPKTEIIGAYDEKPKSYTNKGYDDIELTSTDPVVVSVAEVHNDDNVPPVFTNATSKAQPLPEPEADHTQF